MNSSSLLWANFIHYIIEFEGLKARSYDSATIFILFFIFLCIFYDCQNDLSTVSIDDQSDKRSSFVCSVLLLLCVCVCEFFRFTEGVKDGFNTCSSLSS